MIKINIIAYILAALVIVSAGFNIGQFNNVQQIATSVGEGLAPTHRCVDRGLEYYCFSLSSTLKTCYTLPDGIGGKRCLVEPYWQEIDIPDDICPPCVICPIPIECPPKEDCPSIFTPDCPPEEVCDVCSVGGGGSCPPCPSCQSNEQECNPLAILAYTDNGKYFCDNVGYEANCVKDDTLEMPWYIE